MGDDVAADGLGRVLGERHAVGVGHDLVGNEDGDAEFLGETGQLPEELGHLHLPLGQLAPARIIGPEQGRGRIHHDEGVAILAEDGGRHLEELHLMLAVVGAGVRDVLEGGDGVHVEPLGDGLEPFGAEGPLGVDVHGLALGTAVGDGQLARDAEGVAELRNSPNTSVMDPVSMPPSRSLSSSTAPVVRASMALRSSRASAAVLKSDGTMARTISLILRTLASEMPLTSDSLRTVE
mmetsp:Transcript_29089/g.84532  ORF Transcript_29089/g.84532 Transcript_29089/m.84532 type:complete len:236 (+) Transcript_29089:347-1054(+)